jgi:hypothetical protein
MVVYIQKKIKGVWRTILHLNEEKAHEVYYYLKGHNSLAKYRIAYVREVD